MTQLRGGNFLNGFISGFASKAVSGIMDNTDLRFEPPFVKMSINVILSGAISKASGGDFYQGAMSALVVYLYNDFKTWSYKQVKYIKALDKEGLRQTMANRMTERSLRVNTIRGIKSLTYKEAYQRVLEIERTNKIIGSVAVGIIALPVALEAGTTAYFYAMANPGMVIGGISIIDNAFLGGTPANTYKELGASILHDYNPWAIK